jgi:hypothetical protein
MLEFIKFPKMPRRENLTFSVTEKLDGTNSLIVVEEDGNILAGSRTRWLTEREDNHGFFKFVQENKEDIKKFLIPNKRYYGEFIGEKIQRGYGLRFKRFMFFDLDAPGIVELILANPNFGRVPFFSFESMVTLEPMLKKYIEDLVTNGSKIDPNTKAEGLVIRGAGLTFKVILDKHEDINARL